MEEILKELKLEIESESYKDKLNNVESFGGAGLIITHEGDTRQAEVVVYTKHEKELSWLIYKLANAFGGQIDHMSKYAFYPHIGELANEYIINNGDDSIKEMMLYIINQMED